MFFTKLYEKIKHHPKFFLCIAICLSALIAYYPYVFGDSIFLFNDIGADTQQQYIMQYNTVVNHIRSGNFSIWDFSSGFGTSLYSLNLFDPSFVLMFAAGALFGPQVIAYLLIYLHIGKMILAGLTCHKFLSCFSFSQKSRFFAAYLYAFNGFMTVWGQHYQFSMVVVYLPLFLYCLEMALRKRRFAPSLPLITTCMIIYSYYTGYMSMILGGCYLIVRLFIMEPLSYKERLKRFFLHCSSLVLGICMGLFSLLPGYALVTNVSSRLESSTGLFERLFTNLSLYPWKYYLTLVFRFFSSNLEGIGNSSMGNVYRGYANYYEAPNVFFSSLFVILAVQYILSLFKKGEKPRRKATRLIVSAAVCFVLLIRTGSLIFNGFSAPFSRHTFLLMPLFALMCAYMSDEILISECFSRIGAALTLAGMLSVYAVSYLRIADTRSVKCYIFLLCAVGVLMILLLNLAAKKREMPSKKLLLIHALLFSCIAANVISDTHMTIRGRSTITKQDPAYFDYLYGEDMQDLQSYLSKNDPYFYRLEKTMADVSLCMESCAQNYRGVSVYNSTLNRNLIEFVQRLIPQMNLVDFSRITYRHLLHDDCFATLFGIKYLVTDTPDYSSDTYQFVRQFGSLYLYENPYTDSIGHLYTATVDKDTFESAASAIDVSSLISSAVITDEPDDLSLTAKDLEAFYTEPLPDYLSTADTDDEIFRWRGEQTLSFRSDLQLQDAPVTMSFDLTTDAPTELTFITENGISDTTQFEYVMSEYNQTVRLSLTIPRDTTTLRCTARYSSVQCSISNISFTSQSPADDFSGTRGITVDQTDNDSHLAGTITAAADSFAFLSIPYETGWSATLDGEPVDLERADYGFTGFYVSAGEHSFTLTYTTPLLKEGICLSILFWIVYLILFARFLYLKHHRKFYTQKC